MTRSNWNVAVLAYDGLCLFEYGIPIEIFGTAREAPWYRLDVIAAEPGDLRGDGGVRIETAGGLEMLDRIGTIVVPGWRDVEVEPPEPLLAALRDAHRAGARIVSLCSGAFVLGAAGLLDGRRAATHWRYAARLTERFPKACVDPEVLYVDAGSVLTSAGSAAGIDLCLHLVRRDCGAAVANAVARRLVVPPHRRGGQKQFIETPIEASREPSLASVLDGVRERLEASHTVASMAQGAGLSTRTFARRFVQMMGTTPIRWLIAERVRRAQTLLETTDLPLDRVAESSGFADTQILRLHFRRLVGNPPSVYRRAFRE